MFCPYTVFFILQLAELQVVLQDLLQASPSSFPPLPPHQAVLGHLAFSLVEVSLIFQIRAKDQAVCSVGESSIPTSSGLVKTYCFCNHRRRS